jgi:UDP-N-acetylglucosamine acyltransferase
MTKIHKTAIVHESAKIGEDCEIGPYAIIENDVTMGRGNKVAAHASIKEYTTMGNNNEIGEGSVIGGKPQDLKFQDEKSFLHIGDNNKIREMVTIHIGTEAGSSTKIGDHCFIMGYVHIAHNCELENHVIIANYTGFSGHVSVGEYTFISAGVLVHQNARIGKLAMIGGGTRLRMDTLPFFTVNGDPPGLYGLNLIGLRRSPMTRESIKKLRDANRILFYAGNKLEEALLKLETEDDEYVEHLVKFIRDSKRGFYHPMKGRRRKPDSSVSERGGEEVENG